MGILRLKYSRIGLEDEFYNFSLPSSRFKEFNSSLLGLGDLSKDGETFEALAAVFDLEGFTSFCSQIDPHLAVPEYLSRFLDWLFDSISDGFFQERKGKNTILWCQLPFYAKFLGDGVLFLWDTKGLDPILIGNIVSILQEICANYTREFVEEMKKSVTNFPTKLRCGIARGGIISLGEGKDFVGPCINVAARLQKLGQFSFAFSRRGFDLATYFADGTDDFVLVRTPIRGIGDQELLFVLRAEFRKLTAKERKQLTP